MATITTSVVTGGTNSHSTTVAEVNATRTDFVTQGVVGTITSTSGIAPNTGSFAVNAQGTPAMFVDVTAGTAYILATPAGQVSQNLRANMVSTYTSYAINSNSSGSTKYDWIYLKVDPTSANNPLADASDVTSVYTSRSSSNTTDNGSPPTYGILLAVVTVANGATSITNANIAEGRTNATMTVTASNTFFFDFIESGCVWTADSVATSLNASMTAGFIWISGKRLRVAAVSARAFTAAKDTYVDFTDNGDGTAAVTYTLANNNAASPALASGAIRNAIIVAGASSIAAQTSVNQGQETMVLPIASSIPYAVTDSLGNLICPRDPQRKLLGYRQIITNFSTASGTFVDITGLNLNCIIPTGRKVKVSGYIGAGTASVVNDAGVMNIFDVTASVQLNQAQGNTNASGDQFSASPFAITTPNVTTKNYKAQFARGSNAATANTQSSSTIPSYIMVELE